MVTSLVNAPINLFHDKTPKGRIYNRISNDLNKVEDCLWYYGFCLTNFFNFLGALVICSIYQIWSLVFMPIMLILGFFIVKYYLQASRDLVRMEGIAHSPVLNIITEVIPGSMIIRANKFEEKYFEVYNKRLDDMFKINLFVAGTQNWFGITMDYLAYLFLVFLILFAIIFETQFEPHSIGLLLVYALEMQSSFFYFLSMCGMFTNIMINMERCLAFTKIPSENYEQIEQNLGEWPYTGRVEVIDYSVRYRPDTDIVLNNISFSI